MEWEVSGYCRDTGEKVLIRVKARVAKQAKTVASVRLIYPVVIGRGK